MKDIKSSEIALEMNMGDGSNVGPVLTELADKINAEHEKVRQTFTAGIKHALETGRLLGFRVLSAM